MCLAAEALTALVNCRRVDLHEVVDDSSGQPALGPVHAGHDLARARDIANWDEAGKEQAVGVCEDVDIVVLHPGVEGKGKLCLVPGNKVAEDLVAEPVHGVLWLWVDEGWVEVFVVDEEDAGGEDGVAVVEGRACDACEAHEGGVGRVCVRDGVHGVNVV